MRLKAIIFCFFFCLMNASPVISEQKPKDYLLKHIHPIVSIFGGYSNTHASYSKTYVGDDNNLFSYHDQGNSQNAGLGGIFLGSENRLRYPNLVIQTGIQYNYFGSINESGSNTVGIEPATSTFYNYHYELQIQQLLALGKLLLVKHSVYHPYIFMGLGAAFNHASHFSASTEETGSVNLTPNFSNYTATAFSYNLGLGVDANVNQHVRIGLEYRFSDFGKSQLGNGKITLNNTDIPTSFTLNISDLYSNQLVAQISYLF